MIDTHQSSPAEENISTEDLVVHKKSSRWLLLPVLMALVLAGVGISLTFYSKAKNPDQLTLNTFPTAMPVEKPQLFLTLESPSEETMAVNGAVLVKGKTLPDTSVMLFTEGDDDAVQSDIEGNFEGVVMLAKGSNTLTVTAIGVEGDETSQTVTITY